MTTHHPPPPVVPPDTPSLAALCLYAPCSHMSIALPFAATGVRSKDLAH